MKKDTEQNTRGDFDIKEFLRLIRYGVLIAFGVEIVMYDLLAEWGIHLNGVWKGIIAGVLIGLIGRITLNEEHRIRLWKSPNEPSLR